ncbi:hypothetical protein ONZ43_g5268 [Nemania bipapillata]|uniref:Uncharacterized protein n=1 Tax=Nemania bipapillata TaxID=110536 RepID=A0ACC2ICL8_9PEZI|nr:hypothetical protein ONZ43_g5268 [Nemania bipapillata]
MASSTSKVRFAVVGVGLIGPRHARTVAGHDAAQLVAIIDPMPAAADIAGELGVTHHKSIAECLQSRDKPDAAIICTPNHTHVAVAKELIAGGVSVLIEKPISTDIPSGEALVQELANSPVKALVGHHRRFNPYIVATKKILESGSLGKVIAVNGLWATYKPLDYFDPPTQWRRDKTAGVVYINMIHEIDLLHHLFGTISTVHAERTVSQRGFEAEEGAALTLRFHSGAVGSFILSDNVPSPYNFEAGTGENPLIPKTGQDFYRIFGTEGCLSVPDMTVWSYKDTTKSWLSELSKECIPTDAGVPFELQLSHFVKVIHGQEAPSCTPQAGLAALIVCQAIKEAIASNSTVGLANYSL